MDQIRLKALAKINLGLDIVRKREDGYHDVKMIMQTVDLYDQIFIKKIPNNKISIKTNLYYLPVNENNLVHKAAKLLLEEFGITQGLGISLYKFIPVAAGLGGGSADAAATLFGVNKLFHLGLTTEELMERAVKLGADVPYCLMRGTALAEGIGEKLTPLPPMPKCYILIAKPGISVSTKFVYENLNLNQLESHPDIDAIVEGLKKKNLNMITDNMENVLETVTIGSYPIIEKIKDDMKGYGALNAMMSGSGPTVFGIFDHLGKAKYAYKQLRMGKLAKQVYLTNVFNCGGKK
ncbi:MAG TPA: 4-(cytidine 5'-diphospho)-2-C-methyl-D-erythritol kinase [Candidatus Merdenecus merdavium]|nr:4-(cytidine 5'-diphospho)-2-C-methyl-D-erythritol kinase [Candidatus Merdenecus merdavium]